MFSKLLAGSIFALSLGKALAGVQFAGVNIAGFDFGCGTDGTCTVSNVDPPLSSQGGQDGAGQMAHFSSANSFNMYRLPIAWQYLTNNVLGGTLDATNLAKYDALVQACLTTGSHCIIDIHNYARWNDGIIGQGGPTNDQFASVWSQLAKKYATESKVIMGIMNEPHDIPDINAWADSVQAAVTAIRTAGATSQICLLPGNGYTSAGTFVSGGSAAALSKVTNPDGSTTNLIFDVHKYLDSDGSGTHADCTSNQIDDSFSPLATYLRTNKRQALLSETGGGSDSATCLKDVCQALNYLNTNSDVYLGYVGWGAGSFATSYVLSLTPSGSAASGWTDQPLVSQCFAAIFSGSGKANTTSSVALSVTSVSLSVSISSSVAAVPTSNFSTIASSPFPSPSASTFPTLILSSISTLPGIFPTGSGTGIASGASKPYPTSTSLSKHHRSHTHHRASTFSTVTVASSSSASTSVTAVAGSGPNKGSVGSDSGDDECER